MSKNTEKTAILAAVMEGLENRLMLSASLAKGILRVNGSSSNDSIRVAKSGNRIVVTINGIAQSFKRGGITSIRVIAGAESDSVSIRTGIPSRISGGPGNDYISGGQAADSIDGGDGHDAIDGRGGDDTLLGSAGNDTIIGRAGNDSILGGDGRDDLAGDDGNDLLNGEAETDTISGGAGTDLDIDIDDRLIDPDTADQDLNSFFAGFPGLFNSLFPNGPGNTGGLGDIFGNGGNIFGSGGGSIFG